jgi:enhancing lycopene biosynthesis protein 2
MMKIAVVLSGCGYLDGAEIREAVGVLWALSSHENIDVQCFAPDQPQHHVIDHLRKQEVPGETRNVLTESARIARGKIKPLTECQPSDIAALIMPGGFGAAKNLCDFAFNGSKGTVLPLLKDIVQEMHSAGKPIGAACIAPAILALSLQSTELTVGAASAESAEIEKLGHTHVVRKANEMLVDTRNRIVTTPAYMYDDAPLHEVFDGIKQMVDEVVRMASE